MSEAFTFGIPLIARSSARDWPLVERLLGLTLASVRAQSEGDFRVLVVGHDRPNGADTFDFVQVDWPPEDVRADNLDSGRSLDVAGNYFGNTSANHSEEHGPFAAWRREFAAGVARDGEDADGGFLQRFGLTRELIQSVLPAVANE